jgi:hypothetical protein
MENITHPAHLICLTIANGYTSLHLPADIRGLTDPRYEGAKVEIADLLTVVTDDIEGDAKYRIANSDRVFMAVVDRYEGGKYLLASEYPLEMCVFIKSYYDKNITFSPEYIQEAIEDIGYLEPTIEPSDLAYDTWKLSDPVIGIYTHPNNRNCGRAIWRSEGHWEMIDIITD